MIAPFDIFRTENDGTQLWCGTAGTMEEAQSRIGELSVNAPGEYVILSRRTGNKVIIRPGDADES
jgi:hypothetical protein